MWWVLLAAAVAGSTGFATKHFLTPRDTVENDTLHHPNAYAFYESGSVSTSHKHDEDGVFTFSSSQSPKQSGPKSRPKKPRGSKNGVRVQKVEQRLPFCLKKRKTTKNVAAKATSCSSKAGKAEINKLNTTVDETAKLVQELKSELNRRKSSCAHQILDSVANNDMNSRKMSGRHGVMLKDTNSKLRDTDVKIWSPSVNDCGECGSSALTEEPEPQVLEMDQLEAELEFELQKLPGCTIDSPCQEELKPKLDELEAPDEGCHGTDDWNFNHSQSHGVLASELNQKLSHLLIKQQENQIMELESELHQAQSNLHEKEAELQALKECVRCLTELSLSTVSDDETQAALTDPKGPGDWDNNDMKSEPKQSVVGAKRPIDYDSCSCYM